MSFPCFRRSKPRPDRSLRGPENHFLRVRVLSHVWGGEGDSAPESEVAPPRETPNVVVPADAGVQRPPGRGRLRNGIRPPPPL
jgi:hypothetical protein